MCYGCHGGDIHCKEYDMDQFSKALNRNNTSGKRFRMFLRLPQANGGEACTPNPTPSQKVLKLREPSTQSQRAGLTAYKVLRVPGNSQNSKLKGIRKHKDIAKETQKSGQLKHNIKNNSNKFPATQSSKAEPCTASSIIKP